MLSGTSPETLWDFQKLSGTPDAFGDFPRCTRGRLQRLPGTSPEALGDFSRGSRGLLAASGDFSRGSLGFLQRLLGTSSGDFLIGSRGLLHRLSGTSPEALWGLPRGFRGLLQRL
jgi:hypothetical protein